MADIIPFLQRAKRAAYAGKGTQTAPSRPASHDLAYCEGEMSYLDTYLGGLRFAGEEAVWRSGVPCWSMNYVGRVTGDPFDGDFLKEALLNVPSDRPYRGPESYQRGDYSYHCRVDGDFEWFQGYETICFQGREIYDCYFHGSAIL